MHSKPTYEELLIKIQELEKLEYKRNQTALELKHRYKFEKIIAEISSEFVGIRTESIDKVIDRALSLIGTFTEADRAYIFQFKNDTMLVDNTHEWCAVGVEPQIENIKDIPVGEELPWFAGHIRRRNTFHVPDVAALPPEARLEREHFEAQNIQSLIVVPMEMKERLIGFLGFDSVRNRRTWNDDDKSLLRFFGQTLSHVIERTRAENALKEANIILNRSPAVAFTWINQEDWPIEFVTENVENIFGYTAKEFLSGKVLYANCVHKDDLKRVGNEVKTFSNEKDTTEFNHLPYRIVTKDGDIKIVSDWTFINRDDEGNITYYKGIIEDITKRKQAEEALCESEERYRLHFENVLDVIYTIDSEFKLLDVSPSMEKLLGYKPKELIGRPFQDLNLLAPEYLEQAFSDCIRIFKGERITSSVYQFIARDGTKKWGEISGAPVIRDNQVVAITSVARDITERKQVEVNLRESDERYRGLFERSLEYVYLCDFEGNFIDANNTALEGLGYTKKDIKFLNFMSLLDKDQLPRAIESVEEILKTGSQKGIVEFRLKRKDGTHIDIESKGAIIYADGKPYAIQGIARDISGRKKLEEEREKLIYELRQALEKVKQLGGLLPICSHCKKIRDDKGYWNQVESYIRDHSDAKFSHGICPECAEKYYPDMDLYGENET